MATTGVLLGADYLEDGVINYLSLEHPLLFAAPVVATMGAFVAGHLRRSALRPAYETRQDDDGNPYVPLPPTATADMRQCIPTEDGTGWQVVAFDGHDCVIEATGRTLAEAIAAAEGYKASSRPQLPAELTVDFTSLPDNVIPAFLPRSAEGD